MNRIHQIVAIVYLVLWVPVTGHCRLEKIPGMEFLRCASDTAENSNCDGDFCQSVESGQYKISDHQTVIAMPLFAAFSLPVLPLTDDFPCKDLSLEVSIDPPPELSSTWQFSSGAAPRVRAPSVAS